MTIYNVYKTDNWHSYASRDFCGAFGSRQKAIACICAAIRKDVGKKKFDAEDIVFMLRNYNQTQCTHGIDYEFDIDAVQLNVWDA